MTDHNREELIEALADGVHECDGWMSDAQNAQLEWDGPNRVVHFCGQGSIDVGHLAAIAEAVFEQAQAATAHPAHSGHEYGGGYARAAALAAGDPDWMNATGGTPTAHECTWACWVDRYGQDHHTPTVDERERIEQSNDIAYTVIEVAQNKAPEEFVTLDFRYGIADALWDAGYRKTRRTVQGEPTDDEREARDKAMDEAWGFRAETRPLSEKWGAQHWFNAGWDARARRAVQGEPTDAQVLAGLNAYYADYMIGPNKSLSEVRPPRTVHDMRAALRAAYETKGEGR